MSFILPVLKHFQLFMAIRHTLYTVYVILARGEGIFELYFLLAEK